MSGLTIGFVGHATVSIELDGCRLLTDPLLRNRVAHLRRVAPLGAGALGAVDAALVSHGHWDHLDLPSLRRLGAATPVVVPRGLGRLLRRRGFEDVREVEAGEHVGVGALSVVATPADHEGARGPLGPRADAVGYAVLGSRRVLFLGDTGLFPGMDALVDDLDVALVPVWGWGHTLGRGRHLDPEQAAEAVRRIRPRIAVPIHWGTFRVLHRSGRVDAAALAEPAERFAAAAAARAPGVEVRLLHPGEQTGIV